MAEFRLTRLARQDLRDIGQFTQQRWGMVQRNDYLDALVAAFALISERTNLGRPCDELKAGLLSYLCGSHAIYFRRMQGGVEILRILHQRMHAASHL